MLVGPILQREWITTPRQVAHYAARVVVLGALFVLMWTTWQAVVGFEEFPTLAQVARFNRVLFELLAFVQLALVLFGGSVFGAQSVSFEKERRTFVLLLVTRLSDRQIVVEKFLCGLLQVGVLVLAVTPIFSATLLLGGVGPKQLGLLYAATAGGALLSIGVGVLIATWREKSFQALSLTVLAVVLSLLGIELAAALLPGRWVAYACDCLSPVRAILASWRAIGPSETRPEPAFVYLAIAVVLAAAFLTVAVVFLRRWNPKGDPIQQSEALEADQRPAATGESADPKARGPAPSREVWDNPVLWREVRTSAYGTRGILIKLGYLGVFAVTLMPLLAWGLDPDGRWLGVTLALLMLPIAVVGLLLTNAQALTAVTTERDLKSLDLLLVTDLSPAEFVVGKLAGAAFNAKEMLLAPIVFLVVAAAAGLVPILPLLYSAIAFLSFAGFALVLGVHAGLRHPTSRQSLAHSLGTMFLLSVGILICLYLILISGRFEAQWLSFVFFIVMGSIGLWLSLSANAPSNAITLVASIAPVATFYAVVAFVVGDRFGPFAVTTGVYGFAIAALLVPLLSEFDVATGRSSAAGG